MRQRLSVTVLAREEEFGLELQGQSSMRRKSNAGKLNQRFVEIKQGDES